MAGFFKKLFNRIIGKGEEAPAPAVEQAVLPAPEPVAEAVGEREPDREPASELIVEDEVLAPVPAPEVSVVKKTVEKKSAAKKAAPPPSVKVAPVKGATDQTATVKATPGKATPGKLTSKKKTVETPKVVAKSKTENVAPARKDTHKAQVPAAKSVEVKPKAVPPLPVPVHVPKVPPSPPAPIPAPVVAEVPKPVVEVPRPAVPPAAPEPLTPRTKPFAKVTPQAAPVIATEPERRGWLARLKSGLSKSSKSISGSITSIFTKRKLDASTLQELEDTLIQADLGLAVSERIMTAVATGRYDKEIDPEEVKQILADEVAKVLKPVEVPFNFGAEKPYVILVVGVNGSGKTTTIGKLGAIAAGEDFKVKFAACDTFRAAAIEQLTVWGKRIGAETISRPQGADAAGLAFDAMKASHADGTDILFIDTAGRLHNKTYLMDELDKVVRVVKKYDAAAPHAVLLVLDATTGQNALAQAEAFTKVAGVTGLIMTKLDGTARGGILVAIAEKFKLPIHAIGVGETIDDLQPFDAEAFARAIAGLED
jgi:fused signal recognition particle receptor